MVMRALIAGMTLQDHELRESSLDKLMEFVERHVNNTTTDATAPSSEPKVDDFHCRDSDIFKQHILMILGEVHDAFM